ncbi:protein FAM200C-like [Lycorma delicatula]|uniref:protein FAM200C-like n=1 Tax=Lycorma delicatula TaxID=130591 RepID=UPI003F5141C0
MRLAQHRQTIRFNESYYVKKRQWNDKYVGYGFTCTTEKDGTQRPQCILCSKIFSNSNLKPSKLLEHFNNLHGGEGVGHSVNNLKSKKSRFDTGGTILKLCQPAIQKPLLEAGIFVCKEKKPHTTAEELIKPCALIIAETVLDSEAHKKIQQIPLSNDIIRSRIQDLGKDILLQIIEDIKASPLKVSVQLDESTDVDKCSQLLVFVRWWCGDLFSDSKGCGSLKRLTNTGLDERV